MHRPIVELAGASWLAIGMNTASGDDRRIRGLIDGVRQMAARGDLQGSEQLLRQSEREAPHHPLVLNQTALRLLRGGEKADALAALERLSEAHPSYADVWFNLALVRREMNRLGDAIAALDRGIAIEPNHVAALLEKAALQERQDNPRAAAATYHAALQMIPPGFDVPPSLRDAVQRARQAVDANNAALERFIEEDLAPLRARYAHEPLRRFDRCVDVLLRKNRIYRQQPTFMYFPEMPAIEFYERDHFPWLARLEAATDDIRNELLTVLGERGSESLLPYNAGPAGAAAPVDRDDPRRWRSYPFWREGVAFPDHMARCPRTMAAIDACPHWDAPGIGPNAMFSILDPMTRIPPHTGTANTRVVAHLALVVPPGCGFRVGASQREWHPGEAFVFDDTIEHEAWNDSGEMRAILIVDVWSPFLRNAERDLVRTLCERVGKYYGTLQAKPEPAPVRNA